MAIERIIIRTERDIDGVKIDGILTENTDVKVRVTTNPIESGADIIDHVIKVPVNLTLEGVITDTPLGAAAFANIGNAIGGAIDSLTGLVGSSESQGLSRSQQGYKMLVDLLKKRELISIKTKLSEYDNLVFQSIIVNQDKNTSRAVFFTATFIEVFLVQSGQLLNVDRRNISSDDQANTYSDYEDDGQWETESPSANTITRIENGGQI